MALAMPVPGSPISWVQRSTLCARVQAAAQPASRAYLHTGPSIASNIADMQPIAAQVELEERFAQLGDSILLADLRAPNCLEVLSDIKTNRPVSVIIAMGADRSDPMLAAEVLDPFALSP